jgi:hypothetical protein
MIVCILPYQILLIATVQQLAVIDDLGQVLNESTLNVTAIEVA